LFTSSSASLRFDDLTISKKAARPKEEEKKKDALRCQAAGLRGQPVTAQRREAGAFPRGRGTGPQLSLSSSLYLSLSLSLSLSFEAFLCYLCAKIKMKKK